jgi:hypothetical protein
MSDRDDALIKGSGGAMADAAPADEPRENENDPHAPHARKAGQSSGDQLSGKGEAGEDRQEALIDEGVEETFPASDPVSVKRIT